MKNYRLVTGIILIFALIAGNLWLYIFKPAEKVPDLIFSTTNNESFSFNKMAGKPILVTFWASSCGVCMADMPKLKTLHSKYTEKGLQMFSIAMPYDNEATVQTIAKGLPFHVVLDPKAVIANAFGKVMFTPTNFLIDPKGEIALKEVGPLNLEQIEKALQTML